MNEARFEIHSCGAYKLAIELGRTTTQSTLSRFIIRPSHQHHIWHYAETASGVRRLLLVVEALFNQNYRLDANSTVCFMEPVQGSYGDGIVLSNNPKAVNAKYSPADYAQIKNQSWPIEAFRYQIKYRLNSLPLLYMPFLYKELKTAHETL